MIEVCESRFGYWPNEQHSWLFTDETEEMSGILEQLYTQMLGWA